MIGPIPYDYGRWESVLCRSVFPVRVHGEVFLHRVLLGSAFVLHLLKAAAIFRVLTVLINWNSRSKQNLFVLPCGLLPEFLVSL
jgi:hypothetical protein